MLSAFSQHAAASRALDEALLTNYSFQPSLGITGGAGAAVARPGATANGNSLA